MKKSCYSSYHYFKIEERTLTLKSKECVGEGAILKESLLLLLAEFDTTTIFIHMLSQIKQIKKERAKIEITEPIEETIL